jgi:hypothetical protein
MAREGWHLPKSRWRSRPCLGERTNQCLLPMLASSLSALFLHMAETRHHLADRRYIVLLLGRLSTCTACMHRSSQAIVSSLIYTTPNRPGRDMPREPREPREPKMSDATHGHLASDPSLWSEMRLVRCKDKTLQEMVIASKEEKGEVSYPRSKRRAADVYLCVMGEDGRDSRLEKV